MNVLLDDHGEEVLSDTSYTHDGFRSTTTGKRRGPPLTPLETFPMASPFSLCVCPQSSSEASYVPTPVASNRAKTKVVAQHKKQRQIIPQETIDHLHGMLESLTFGVLQSSTAWQSQSQSQSQTSLLSHGAPTPPEKPSTSSKKLAVTLFPTDTTTGGGGGNGFHNDCGVPTLAPPRCRDSSVRRSVLGPTHRGSNNNGRASASSHHHRRRTRRIRTSATPKRPSPPGVLLATPTAMTPSSASASSSRMGLQGMEVRTRPKQHRTHYGDIGSVKRGMSPAAGGTGFHTSQVDPVAPRPDPGTGSLA